MSFYLLIRLISSLGPVALLCQSLPQTGNSDGKKEWTPNRAIEEKEASVHVQGKNKEVFGKKSNSKMAATGKAQVRMDTCHTILA